MKSQKLLPLVACGLALAALPAFANDDESSSQKFKRLDTDGDGRVSRSEFVAGAQAKLQRMDANNDGAITPNETSAKAEKKHWWSRSDKSPEKVNKADTDHDGVVTAAEASTAAGVMFDECDTDHDGFLTSAELAAGHKDHDNK